MVVIIIAVAVVVVVLTIYLVSLGGTASGRVALAVPGNGGSGAARRQQAPAGGAYRVGLEAGGQLGELAVELVLVLTPELVVVRVGGAWPPPLRVRSRLLAGLIGAEPAQTRPRASTRRARAADRQDQGGRVTAARLQLDLLALGQSGELSEIRVVEFRDHGRAGAASGCSRDPRVAGKGGQQVVDAVRADAVGLGRVVARQAHAAAGGHRFGLLLLLVVGRASGAAHQLRAQGQLVLARVAAVAALARGELAARGPGSAILRVQHNVHAAPAARGRAAAGGVAARARATRQAAPDHLEARNSWRASCAGGSGGTGQPPEARASVALVAGRDGAHNLEFHRPMRHEARLAAACARLAFRRLLLLSHLFDLRLARRMHHLTSPVPRLLLSHLGA